jgi:hypothetical protein
MTRNTKLYEAILAGHVPLFRKLCALVEAFGFELKRTNGSHHIYRHPHVQSSLNIQPVGNDAKGYQVRQFLAMVRDNELTIKDGG